MPLTGMQFGWLWARHFDDPQGHSATVQVPGVAAVCEIALFGTWTAGESRHASDLFITQIVSGVANFPRQNTVGGNLAPDAPHGAAHSGLALTAMTSNTNPLIDYGQSRSGKVYRTLGRTAVTGAVVLATACASVPDALPVRVTETANLVNTADDPVIKGLLPDAFEILGQLPPTPPEFAGRGAHRAFDHTEWTFLEEVELQPGQTKATTVAVKTPSVVRARGSWSGGAGGTVALTVVQEGVTLATGAPRAIPRSSLEDPDSEQRGAISAAANVGRTGTATVAIANTGAVRVRVSIAIGVLPRSPQ
jgi:hypothetical protein